MIEQPLRLVILHEWAPSLLRRSLSDTYQMTSRRVLAWRKEKSPAVASGAEWCGCGRYRLPARESYRGVGDAASGQQKAPPIERRGKVGTLGAGTFSLNAQRLKCYAGERGAASE
jgi:hypothetical protein